MKAWKTGWKIALACVLVSAVLAIAHTEFPNIEGHNVTLRNGQGIGFLYVQVEESQGVGAVNVDSTNIAATPATSEIYQIVPGVNLKSTFRNGKVNDTITCYLYGTNDGIKLGTSGSDAIKLDTLHLPDSTTVAKDWGAVQHKGVYFAFIADPSALDTDTVQMLCVTVSSSP